MNTTSLANFECRDIFDKLETHEINIFLEACDLLWNIKSKPKDIVEETLEKIATKSNFMVRDNDEWKFINPELLYFGQALNIIYDRELNTIQSGESLQILFENLRNNEEHDFLEQKKATTYAFIHLINMFKRFDLLDEISSNDLSDRGFWNSNTFFQDAIPFLEIDIHQLGNFLISVAEKGKGDLAGSSVYGATEQIGLTRPEIGRELTDYFSQVDNPIVIEFIQSLMTGIANNSEELIKEVISQCESWFYSENSILAQSALYSLKNLVVQQKYDVNRFIEHISSIFDTPNEDLRVGFSFALTRIGLVHERVGEEALKLLQQLMQIGPIGKILHGIVSSLSRERNINNFGIGCLQLSVNTPLEQKGTIQQIDMILYPISESNPKFVWDFLDEWIKQHDSEEPISQHDIFLNRIQQLYSVSIETAVQVLTSWFVSPDLRLVEESRLILRELNIHGFYIEIINQLTIKETIYASEKILAGGFDSSQISSLLISIFRNTRYLEDLLDYFQQELWYLAWNYPGGTSEVLARGIDLEQDEKIKQVLENTQSKLREYQDRHNEVNVLFKNELASSLRRVQKFREFEAKRFQQISQATMEDSRHPLLSIIPRVSVGRGNRSFHMDVFNPDVEHQRTFSEPSGFGKISGGFELPKGEFLDPEGEYWRKIQRRSLQLEDIQWEEE